MTLRIILEPLADSWLVQVSDLDEGSSTSFTANNEVQGISNALEWYGIDVEIWGKS